MAEDPFEMIKIVMLLLLASLMIMSTHDANATTCRNSSVKHQFDKLNGYPQGREGYVVDHVCALAKGGLDAVINMQYQTIDQGHKKDRIENSKYGRSLFCTPENSTPTRQVFNCK